MSRHPKIPKSKPPIVLSDVPHHRLHDALMAIYGTAWQRGGMETFEVSRQTLWRWIAGKSALPADVNDRLAYAARRQSMRHIEAMQDMSKFADMLDNPGNKHIDWKAIACGKYSVPVSFEFIKPKVA